MNNFPYLHANTIAMIASCNLHKMRAVMSDPVDYYLSTDGGEIRLNDLIHRRITLRYQHEIHCLRITSYNVCYTKLLRSDITALIL